MMYSDRFKNFVWMMGPLHVEMALLKAIGDWLKDSRWLGSFNKANISIPGRVDSFLSGSHVKRFICPSLDSTRNISRIRL